MDDQPGIFSDGFGAACFVLALLAFWIFAMSILSGEWLAALAWGGGGALVLRGLTIRENQRRGP